MPDTCSDKLCFSWTSQFGYFNRKYNLNYKHNTESGSFWKDVKTCFTTIKFRAMTLVCQSNSEPAALAQVGSTSDISQLTLAALYYNFIT